MTFRSRGQILWDKAKMLIPGGNMLLSKRAEMFLPDLWPSYYSKAKGVDVWDIDGNKYLDMGLMGVGTNLLGYSHSEVDKAVSRAVNNGNMSSLNSPEEVELAERLVLMHPWADMVRHARTGGEANAIAIRIARAATGRDGIAMCGYHGWHDWYLACNLEDTGRLSTHLLPGLEPNGVPRSLLNTVFPFRYNCLDELKTIVNEQDIAAVKMEVQRNEEPSPGFLEGVRKLCSDKGIVLIFDECTSGFREAYGGLHLKYGVNPDMAIFGKALGNGYAITSIIGRRAVMEAAQTTFISSTFWTERIGPTAACATLDIMQRDVSWEYVTSYGRRVKKIWKLASSKHSINIEVMGLDALATFRFEEEEPLMLKTLFTQEMLRRGFLATTALYPSTAHTSDHLDQYWASIDEVFELMSKCKKESIPLGSLLEGEICHSGFKRLN